jgi:uncharacterized membrane-anchored protein
MPKKIVLFSLVLILIAINWSIYQKEAHLKYGKVVYLKLIPVDPRSLMQGDYMALRFALADKITQNLSQKTKLKASDGMVIVTLDKQNRGIFKSLDTQKKLAPNEIRLEYRVRNHKVKLASNAFFFQEGHAKIYEKAKYGEFRVKENKLLLANMYDENLKKLGKH